MSLGKKGSIREVIDAVRTEEGMKNAGKIWVDYARISQEEAEKIFTATGIRVNGYVRSFAGGSLKHVERRHGARGERRQDQIPVTEADFEAIPEMIKTADETIAGAQKTAIGNDTIVHLKKRAEGDVLIVEEVQHGRRKLAFLTMRKARAGYTYDLLALGQPIKKKWIESEEANARNDTQPEVGSSNALNPTSD